MKPLPDPLLACKNLTCGYRGRVVLQDVSFELNQGEVVALLGPNGSGKSTLLKTLIRTLPPLSGEARVQGAAVSSLSYKELAQRIAFVPQEEHPTYPFTVREVVTMGRLPFSNGLLDSPDDLEKAEEAMSQADCYELKDRSILELSGGEKQRVWIARALAQSAPVLLLDEPSSHLDVAHQMVLSRLTRELSAKGLAILIAVHDLNLASVLATRAILLKNGRIGADGPIEKILQDPILEDVYKVEFERVTADDRVRVFPKTQ